MGELAPGARACLQFICNAVTYAMLRRGEPAMQRRVLKSRGQALFHSGLHLLRDGAVLRHIATDRS
jgi:hypothetical protein